MTVEMTWNGDMVKALVAGATATGVTKAAHRVQAVTVPRTPLDVGDLRSSILVEPATAADPVATVSTDLPYAARQHEDMALRHKHGGPKFLESAVKDTRGEVAAIIATEISRSTS